MHLQESEWELLGNPGETLDQEPDRLENHEELGYGVRPSHVSNVGGGKRGQ